MGAQLEPLARSHRPLLSQFRCGHESLEVYLRRYALRHAQRDLLSRTWLAVDHTPQGARLAGYFSLTTCSVQRARVAADSDLDRLPGFPIPGVLLARLAVDSRVQGQGLGRWLLEEALGLVLQLALEGPVRFRVLVADAIDEPAVSFYQHFGFVRLADSRRLVLDLRPLLDGVSG